MSDFIDALNLITSAKIHELYAAQDTEDPLVLRKKVRRACCCGYTKCGAVSSLLVQRTGPC